MRVAIVSGGSSGIGKAACAGLQKQGYAVYALCRTSPDLDHVIHIKCDVTNKEEVNASVSQIVQREGRIDLLVNNAGIGISGAAEFALQSDIIRQFAVNVFGAVSCAQAVMPVMRSQKNGRILFISSMAAEFAIPFQSYYSASKAALTKFAEALRMEAGEFGVEICAVMLGDVQTSFTSNRIKLHEGDDIYGGRIQKSVSKMEEDEESGMLPSEIADALIRLLKKPKLPPWRIVGFQYKALYFLSKILPKRAALYILSKMYGR